MSFDLKIIPTIHLEDYLIQDHPVYKPLSIRCKIQKFLRILLVFIHRGHLFFQADLNYSKAITLLLMLTRMR